jgi:hypothetical protein
MVATRVSGEMGSFLVYLIIIIILKFRVTDDNYFFLPILALEAHKPTQVSRAHFSRTIPFRENS